MTSKNVTTTDVIIDLMQQEIDFYSDYDNDNWSNDKNEGFKAGLDYAVKVIKKAKPILDEEEN